VVPLMLALLKRSLASGDAAVAARVWEELSEQGPVPGADRQLLVRLVPALIEAGSQRRAVEALRRIVDPEAGTLPTGMAFRVLDLAQDLDPATALVAARRALQADGLHESKRERLEALVASLSERCASQPAPAEPTAPVAAAGASDSEDLSIPLEYEAVYDFSLPSESAGLQERQARELDPSGSLVETDSDAELLPESVPLDQWGAAPPPPPSGGPETSAPLPEIGRGGASSATTRVLPPPPPSPAPEPPGAAHDLALRASAAVARFCDLKVVEVLPLELADAGLVVQRSGGDRSRVAYDSVEAVAVAAVAGLASKPVLIVDLIVNWNDTESGPLQLLRLRSDGFDARSLVPGVTRSVDAFRALLEQLLARTRAVPLPDLDGARGRPFRHYADLASYQREVLQVDA